MGSDNSYTLMFIGLFVLGTSLATYVVYLANRNSNKVVTQRAYELHHKILHDIFEYLSVSNTRITVTIHAGELYYKNYINYVEYIASKVEDMLAQQKSLPNLNINIYAGSQLMVESLDSPIEEIHPVIKMLYHPVYSELINVYLVSRDMIRIPYHYIITDRLDYGIAETPHKESSAPIVWGFKLDDELREVFELYNQKIAKIYSAKQLVVVDGQLRLGETLVVQQMSDKASAKDSIYMDDLFFKQKAFSDILPFRRGKTVDEINKHREKIGLLMNGWNPASRNIFDITDMQILKKEFAH
ncbi:hypothetical protein ACFL41_01840 [Gemmatimonadota bacterium]